MLRRITAAAVLTAGLLATGTGVAAADPGQCARHPDVCEQGTYVPRGTDHMVTTATARVSSCFLGWCF